MTLTSRRKYGRWRRNRRAVSPVIAELLLIVITVALGTLVYSFASTAFGGFGSGFSNLVQNAGQQLSENIVVEQAYFYNSVANNSGCSSADAGPTHCGGVLFVRNTGSAPVLIDDIFIGNVTSSASEPITTVPASTTFCSSNSLTPANIATATSGQICFYQFATAGPPAVVCGGNPYCNDEIPMTVTNEIMPGGVAIIHFILPVSAIAFQSRLLMTAQSRMVEPRTLSPL